MRFRALDGLRGVAALAVLYLHQLGLFAGGGNIPAALAVDFFFMLSGFVLAHAYGYKLDQGLSWSRYMTARIIRLYPMLLLGIVLGGLVSLAKPGFHDTPATFAASLFVLPVGLLWAAREYPYESATVFLFNGIVWSLFFELIASAIYGTRVRHWRRLWLVPCAVLLVIAGVWDGSVSDLGRHGLIGFFAGFVRVAIPFAFGTVIYRVAVFERFPSLPFWVPALALMGLLVMPMHDGWRYDLICIFIAFPLLLCVGARATSGQFATLLGRLSYPIYLVHWPLTHVVGHVLKAHTANPYVIIPISMTSSILFAWAALVFYDEPVRRRLTEMVKVSPPGHSVRSQKHEG